MDEQALHERAKYVIAYAQEKYARNAGRQGYKNADELREWCVSHNVRTATDFGCGNGALALFLAELGIRSTLIDFMGWHYLDPSVKQLIEVGGAEFHQLSLWDPEIRGLPQTDLAISTDVMEHIPEDKVDYVLDRIAETAPLAFFRIAMHADSPTQIAKRGGALHVTVKPEQWWREKLLERYSTVDERTWTNTKNPQKRVLIAWASK